VCIVFLALLYGPTSLYALVIIRIFTPNRTGGKGYGPDELDNILRSPHIGSTTVPACLARCLPKGKGISGWLGLSSPPYIRHSHFALGSVDHCLASVGYTPRQPESTRQKLRR
jgi:hypothetical protein